MNSIFSEFSAAEIASGIGGIVVAGSENMPFSGVSIDTRTLRSGELFFAIRGPVHDGHSFIPNALSGGASGVVAERGRLRHDEFPPKRVLIEVEDTHQALKDMASAVRRQWPGTPIGITGSMGKTTTKEFVAQMLQTACSVYRSPGNYNNLYGLPLAIFGLKPNDSIGIFEMGMSAPGEIAEMCRIVEPMMGIITNVAPVHLEFFDSLAGIARAKAELADALPANGTLFYNGDICLVRDIAARFGGQKVSFGLNEGADVRADQIEIVGPQKTRFRLRYEGAENSVTIPLAGAHYVMNALAAVAVGRRHGLAPDHIADNLRFLRVTSMRGGILRFREGFAVIDDCYNSNPDALKSMIDVLSRMPSFERRFLVAGEMLELGSASESLHYECGVTAARANLDGIIGVRGAASEIVRAAVDSGMPDTRARFFENTEEAAAHLVAEIREGDLILVKGSRGVRMEKIVRELHSKFECLED
jgi:UDP-N-acetylmuramoyl-tripeptide--D-alanyl-D-alanine ligase